ncbi:MAG: hypothetical protein ISR34_02470 [Pirellulales bacterium]|nr:hypothetical protein [Pirellulales bacterium]
MENFEIFRDIAANKQRSDIRKRLEALEEQGKGVAECPHCAGLLPKSGSVSAVTAVQILSGTARG